MKMSRRQAQKREQRDYTNGSANALQLEIAVDDIHFNKITVREAEAKYNLPHSTIHYRYQKKYGPIRPVEPAPLADYVREDEGAVSVNSDVEEMVERYVVYSFFDTMN